MPSGKRGNLSLGRRLRQALNVNHQALPTGRAAQVSCHGGDEPRGRPLPQPRCRYLGGKGADEPAEIPLRRAPKLFRIKRGGGARPRTRKAGQAGSFRVTDHLGYLKSRFEFRSLGSTTFSPARGPVNIILEQGEKC